MTKAIKGVSEETWQEFRILATQEGITMGKLLENMIEQRKSQVPKKFWNDILNAPKILSDKEADAMLKLLKKSRKEYGWRD